MEKSFSEQIRTLVRSDKLIEAAEVLSQTTLANEGIQILGRLKSLNEKVIKGVIVYQDEELQRNKIRDALIKAAIELESPKDATKRKKKKIIVVLPVLIICLAILYFVYSNFFEQKDLTKLSNQYKYTLAIADFTETDEKPFRRRLIGNIDNGFTPEDSVGITAVGRFIDHIPSTINDTISVIQTQQNINSGLVAYGQLLKGEEMLDCYIHLLNLNPPKIVLGIEIDKIRITETTIKSPDNLEFSIPEKAENTSDFIIALLKYYMGNTTAAIKYFTQISKSSILTGDPKFYKLCNLYIGNSHLLAQQPDSAIKAYQKILAIDSTDAMVYWNSALAHVNNGDYSQAVLSINKSIELTFGEISAKDRQAIDSIFLFIENSSDQYAVQNIVSNLKMASSVNPSIQENDSHSTADTTDLEKLIIVAQNNIDSIKKSSPNTTRNNDTNLVDIYAKREVLKMEDEKASKTNLSNLNTNSASLALVRLTLNLTYVLETKMIRMLSLSE